MKKSAVLCLCAIATSPTIEKKYGFFASDEPNQLAHMKEKAPISISNKPKKKSVVWRTNKTSFNHQYLATSVMGHTSNIMGIDCSADAKFLVTCADDRSIFFWDLRDIQAKGRKSIRVNVEFDHATHIAWSPDDKAFIIHKHDENCIEVYKIEKKKDGLPCTTSKAITFEKVHQEDIVGFGIACNGRFMMSCSSNNDIVIWNLKGEQLAKIDTYMMTTMKAKISPCGRFVAASGFVPEVKVWEVIFDKTGKFKKISRAFELTGHSSGVYDFAFDVGSTYMVTVSKDGTWKLFNTNIDYVKGEMIQLLQTGTYSQESNCSIIGLSPKSDIVVIGSGNCLEVFKADNGELIEKIENAFIERVTNIKFDLLGKYLLVSGDNKVRIFHNAFKLA